MPKRFSVEQIEPRVLFAAAAVDAIANQTGVPVGKTIQIPLTSTSDAGAVSYSIRTDKTKVAVGLRPGTNTFIQMDVQGYSSPMVFELFDDTAPDTVRRIKGLINAKFYDGLTFHRIINNFVIQGGDPNGDGTGGPQGTFGDEFDAGTIFSGTGQLAMANSGKDTNGSQFFITEGPQRALDFNHTIFGQLIRGEATRQAISNLATDSNGAPTSAVKITRVRVIQDSTDAVLVVKPLVANVGVNIKVTGTNTDGSSSKSFTVTGSADSTDDPPILVNPQPVYYTTAGKPITINLSSVDPEGNSANFFTGQWANQNGATGSFSGTNQNIVTITPAAKNGPIALRVGVISSNTAQNRGSTQLAQGDSSGISISDSQLIRIAVGDLPISVTANNGDATAGVAQRYLIGTIRDSDAAGTPSSFTGTVDWGDGTVSSSLTINKRSAGVYNVYATKTYSSKTSGLMPITLTVSGDLGAYAESTSTITVRQATELSGTTLAVNGTAGDDKIGISRKGGNYIVTVNGATTSFATSAVSLIQVLGLAGSDLIRLTDTVFSDTYLDGGDGNDAIYGGSGSNIINAGAGADSVFCGNGVGSIANRVAGGDGNDTITGGTGRDRIFGGAGNDSIQGAAGRDILSGDEGNDIVVGGASADSLYGAAGDDILNGLSGADLVDGGAGTDTYKFDLRDTVLNCEIRV